MSTEELLGPRYKLIADYPGNNTQIGFIILIEHAQTPEAEKLVCGWYDRYPHLFKKLEWWDERAIDEMPEYVKVGIEVYKIDHWFATNGTASVVDEINGGTRNTTFMMKAIKPATLAEYEQYINKKEKQ